MIYLNNNLTNLDNFALFLQGARITKELEQASIKMNRAIKKVNLCAKLYFATILISTIGMCLFRQSLTVKSFLLVINAVHLLTYAIFNRQVNQAEEKRKIRISEANLIYKKITEIINTLLSHKETFILNHMQSYLTEEMYNLSYKLPFDQIIKSERFRAQFEIFNLDYINQLNFKNRKLYERIELSAVQEFQDKIAHTKINNLLGLSYQNLFDLISEYLYCHTLFDQMLIQFKNNPTLTET